jgi:hypothetical protein
VAGDVLGRGQRELGLRRQHAAAVLRRPLPPVRELLPQLHARRQAVPSRTRSPAGSSTTGTKSSCARPGGSWTA